ncbi:MAG: nicotinate-nucleotide--dimethylbenzimidazole phosphoribosyltransferase [Selenomonadaceae bacterium]|nr:nicotinate-nucleotide--dimethylbenzimidazole phosphoribosyltransferase [Selenomonadaceae bacterium]
MTLLEETIARIQPPDPAARKAVQEQLDASPLRGGLGMLQDLLLKYAGITGMSEELDIPKKCAIICCADHGVAAMNVSAYPPETTVQMTENYLISRGAAANALSNFAGSDLLVVDMGIAAATGNIPGLVDCRIANGTANFTEGPAMPREAAIRAIESGIHLASACVENGYRCFLPGEMGIANTTSSAAICAAICHLSPEEATGRGTNISDDRLENKIAAVRQALDINRPDPADGLDVLSKVGGFELGCISGIILGAAAHKACVILDGFNTGAAALIAVTLAPKAKDYLMASHLSTEKGHRAILEKLGLTPYMNLHIRLGEACGSSLASNLLDASIRAYRAITDENDATDPLAEFDRQQMPAEAPKVTDRTFNFYLHTMPRLDRGSMDACQSRLDNLAKPIDCLGYLEQIAVELSGIYADDRPETDLACTLLCFSRSKSLSDKHTRLLHAFSDHAGSMVSLAILRPDLPPTAAFDFGREMAENITFNMSLIGVCLTETSPSDSCGTKATRLKNALLDKNGGLRYAADEFLSYVPKDLKADAAALMGAIIASAHNSSLVILDDEATEIIARYTEALCPDIKPYILHVQPALLQLGMKLPGGAISCLGRSLVEASLHILNDMKTFAETSVATANDGPGSRRQAK